MQKLFPSVGIVSLVASVVLLMISVTLDFSPAFLYGILASILSAVDGVVLLVKCHVFWKTIFVNQDGIFVVSKSGKVYRSFHWEDIRKCAVGEHDGKRYLCVSSDSDLRPEYMHMYGMVWAAFYNKHTISFPADDEVVAYLQYKLNAHDIPVEFTGLFSGKGKKNRSAGVVIFMSVIVLLMWLILFLFVK